MNSVSPPPAKPTTSLDEFRAGALAILPAAIGVIPFGLLLGANAAAKGLTLIEVLLMSGLVFAGSAQFVAVELWRDPAPWLVLCATALTINLRHVMMGASLGRHLSVFSPGERAFSFFFLADEIWALAERRAAEARLTPAYFAGLATLLYVNWLAWTGLGTALGAVIADPRAYGFDFAFSAIFIGLVVGFWKGRATGVVIAASALSAVVAERTLGGVWYILIGGAVGMAVAAALAGRRDEARA